MITYAKGVFVWLGLSVLMMIFWIIGLFIGNAIFPSSFMDSSGESTGHGEIMLFIISALNTAAILYFIYNSTYRSWKLAGTIFLVAFSIQYFMAQIETLWFNDSLKMPINLIWAIVAGGAISYITFAIAATWLSGNFKSGEYHQTITKIDVVALLKSIALLAVIIWPVVYFMAGYLIAWQFSEVRNFYTGTTVLDSFPTMLMGYFTSGLYFFQILRGVFWVLIGLLVLVATKGSKIHKGIILGLLLTILGSSQLLLPNPIMPDMVRLPHLLETSTSSFLWGLILTWFLDRFIVIKINNQTNQAS